MAKEINLNAKEMVDTQLLTRDITDTRVIEAMSRIPRHLFVPGKYAGNAYEDHPLPIGEGQTISQPYIVGLMTQSLCLSGKEKVLEIGTGSGYQTAILAELSKYVYTVERIEKLSIQAGKALEPFGYGNISFKTGDGTLGWEDYAPFDRIIVAAASPGIPEALISQLNPENGKMVIPVGENFNQELTLIEKNGWKIKKTIICNCVFVPLIHEHT